jgi:putative tryptophan/tyrosine transport system substrate-binding protein
MRRRQFIMLLGGAAAAWPLAARGQEPGKISRVAFLANDPNIPAQPAGRAFLDGLRESGFIEGKNVIIERRFAEGRIEQYAALVSELINWGPDVIVTGANDATLAAKRATSQIPIVMMNVYDPVGQGLVPSLARPGGNITGVVQDESAEIATKRLQFLKDAVPNISRVIVLINMDDAYGAVEWKALERAAQSLRLALQAIAVHRVSDYADAFDNMTKERPDAVFIAISAPLHFTNRRLIVELAAKRRLPTISNFRETTEVGGLMSYGSVRTDRFRRAGTYVGNVLKGAKPGDLPIEQPTKFELVINLKTARSLGLEIPRELLVVADEVIE